MKSTYQKLILILSQALLIPTAFCQERFHIKVINDSPSVIELKQEELSNWSNGGDLSDIGKISIPPYQAYVSTGINDSAGVNEDYDEFSLKIAQQIRGKKNYASLFNLVMYNTWNSVFLTTTTYPDRCFHGNDSKFYFSDDTKDHHLTITVTPGLEVLAQYDDGQYSWDSDASSQNCFYGNNKRVYDDVYGKLINLTPYDYFKVHPELLNSNIKLIESTQDVQVVSRGHLKVDNSYSLMVETTTYNAPNFPQAACTLPNGTNKMITYATEKVLHRLTPPTAITGRNSVQGMEDMTLPDLAPLIRDEFEQAFPANPEKFYNWTTANYSSSLNINNSDLDARSYDVDSVPQVANNYLVLDSGPVTPSVTVVDLVGYLDNTTLTNQTMTTAAYTYTATNSETQTVTHGWKLAWKSTFKIPLIGGSEITGEYSGSSADAVSTSETKSLTAPSQNVLVPPGCIAKSQVILNKATIDSDYTAYGSLDKNMPYKMTTPWKNMPATVSVPKKKIREIDRAIILPWGV